MKSIFIVGNKFREFCRNDGVITIGDLSEILRAGTFEKLPSGSRLVAGQGVREAELQTILDQAKSVLMVRGIDMGQALRCSARASRLQTHKHRVYNSIISQPIQLQEDRFEAMLMVDERCELMADHQTGQHIQGMILIEAARQLFLAVTEEYFIGHAIHDRYYFVINRLDVKFTGFVFPIDATLRYDILSKDIDSLARMRFSTLVSVIQGDCIVTEIALEFTAFHASKIEVKEQLQAQILLKKGRLPQLAQHTASAQTSEASDPLLVLESA
jgi:hypothetical protein